MDVGGVYHRSYQLYFQFIVEERDILGHFLPFGSAGLIPFVLILPTLPMLLC